MKALRRSNARGAILVFALLTSAVAVVAMAFWISTISTRARYVDVLHSAVSRRLARENARLIATRYVQTRVIPAETGAMLTRGLGTFYPTTGNYQWGGFRLNTNWAGSTLSSTAENIGVNRISYGPAGTFGEKSGYGLVDGSGVARDLPITLLDGNLGWDYRWQARSFSPALSGDLLVIHRPPAGLPEPSITGNFNLAGRLFVWMGASSQPAVPATVVFQSYGTSGPPLSSRVSTDIVPTNYPPVYHLAWVNSRTTPGLGRLNVVWDDESPGHSLRNKVLDSKTTPSLFIVDGGRSSSSSFGYTSDGSGTVSVDLSNSTLSGVVVENASTLRLIGQSTTSAWSAAATAPTAIVVYRQAAGATYNLQRIRCEGKNNRRVVLGVRKETPNLLTQIDFVDASSSAAGVGPEWRLLMNIERTPASITFTGNRLNLKGGIVTDSPLTGPSGSNILYIYRETSPGGLPTRDARRAWSEAYLLDG